MRSPLRVALVAALAGLFDASGAEAGTLTAATWSQVTQTTWGQFTQGFPMNRSGAQLGITGSSTATSIAASLVYPAFATKFFVPKTANGQVDLAISIAQGGPQALTATPGMASAMTGVPGTAIVRVAFHNSMGVNQSTFMTGVTSVLRVPLNVGVAGQFTGSFNIFGNHLTTVDFYGWTPNTLLFTGLTSDGVALPSVVAMGSFNLTAMGGGTVTLVSPSKISIDGPINQRRTASFTSLKLSFAGPPGPPAGGGGWGCGFGPELTLVLPVLWLLRRERRLA